MDSKANVIGLLKKKTSWYVICRAIREKASTAIAALKKNPSESPKSRSKKTEARIHQIQSWIGFSDAYANAWVKLGSGYIAWIMNAVKEKKVTSERGKFPQQWKQYLSETGQTDEIKFSISE